jgi:hypothetical protein
VDVRDMKAFREGRAATRSTHAHELCDKTLLFFTRTHMFDASVGMYDVEAAIGKREFSPVKGFTVVEEGMLLCVEQSSRAPSG